ncbi:histidine-containing phosphotransfer protein 1-like [Quillaja saponaria]|uniref:Histidine-containing phosphotransfer protein n=1 Tax=Quillaja saponaria TaxID=32244 RepID=A0AAD7Q9M5_QUISA|nr:histidine-containing phosphotransfer protein 1-like [Quillaja saponaria]
MDLIQLRRKVIEHQANLFHEGYLDDQFTQLQKLQDESSPDFVIEVVIKYFDDSEYLLSNLTRALEQPTVDFKQVDEYIHQYEGSSARLFSLHQLKHEYSLQQDIRAAGGSIPVMD